jgi:hypothetical protein
MNRPNTIQVCPWGHDHYAGDWSYADCVTAYEDAKARRDDVARQAQVAAENANWLVAQHLPNLKPGHRYRIVYRNLTQRKDHFSVLDALSETDSYYVLSGRPYVGTQEMPKRWVKSVTEVPRETTIVIGKIVRASDLI